MIKKEAIVKDSTGRQYKFEEWTTMLSSRQFIAMPVDTTVSDPTFILKPVTDQMREKWFANSPKPRESMYFKTGKNFPYLKARTINGDKINTKDLKGKILVINYWFINCTPCQREIPELNELVKRFEKDTNVIFIAIAKDAKRDLKEFFETSPFNYQVIADNVGAGNISVFPTNVVVNAEGKVVFHSSGYAPHSVYWIRKTIEELRAEETASDVRLQTSNL